METKMYQMKKVNWLTDWFYRHVNLSKVILYQEVRGLCSLYVYIYVSVVNNFLHSFIWYQIFQPYMNTLYIVVQFQAC